MIAILRALAAAVALLAFSCDGFAGATFGLAPMRVELSAASPTAILTVNNSGEAPVTIQVQAYTWTQPGGKDVYEETRGFIVSPPIFTIAPGGSQVVRVALRGKPPADIEQAYRLIFREVPPTEETSGDRALFRIALNMNIPLFVAPTAGTTAPKPAFVLEASVDAPRRLSIRNDGTGNLRLSALTVRQGDDKLAEQDVFVVLPGSTRYIVLPKGRVKSGTPLRVEAQSNGGRVDLALPVANP
jgi:fimbrial chaperone protein